MMQTNTALARLSGNTKVALQAQKKTISQVAKQDNCHVSESTLYRVKNASKTGYNPKVKTVVRVANALGTPVEGLFKSLGQS
jgi:DNA-binding phage protein